MRGIPGTKKVAKPAITKAAKAEKKIKPAEAKQPKMSKLISLNPRLSEKAYGLSETRNTYTFDVDKNANKLDISRAIAAQFEVSVVQVRIAALPGKSKRTYRNRGRKFVEGQRSGLRKAYITLKQGDKLPIFAAVENNEVNQETK